MFLKEEVTTLHGTSWMVPGGFIDHFDHPESVLSMVTVALESSPPKKRAAPLYQEVICCVEITRTGRDSMVWQGVLSVVTVPKISPCRAKS